MPSAPQNSAPNRPAPRPFVINAEADRRLGRMSLLYSGVSFLLGLDRRNAARLEMGRERVQARAWSEAVAALRPFDSVLLRVWDRSGEAHFLLAQAYAGLGDKVRAEKARAFVRRKSGSPWAEKLAPNQGPSISRSRAKVYNVQEEGGQKKEGGSEKRPTPPKTKPRRRF